MHINHCINDNFADNVNIKMTMIAKNERTNGPVIAHLILAQNLDKMAERTLTLTTNTPL